MNTILIEGAEACELDLLHERLAPEESIAFGGWEAHIAELDGARIALLDTGIGAANAAAATALAISALKPCVVISQGAAGAHDASLHTGDIVLGETIVRIGAYRSEPTPVGGGIHPQRWLPLTPEGLKGEPLALRSDALFMRIALLTALRCGYSEGASPRVIQGVLGSGDVWNRELDMIAHIRAQTGSSCEDMESYAAAQVCARMGARFLGLRVITNSDPAGESYVESAASGAQSLTYEVVRALIEAFS